MSGRAERPLKKVRRVSTDSDGTEGGLDLIGLNGRAATPTKKGSQRSRRTALDNKATATVSRGPAPAQSTSPQSMRLTVKTSANKLREATRSSSGTSSRASAAVKDPFIGGQIIEGKRARNVKKSYVMESESDEEEDVEMQDDDEEEDADEDADEEEEEEEEDAEGELDDDAEDDGLGDEDADGDIDMDLPAPPPPPPPVIKISRAQSSRQSIVVKPPPKVDTRIVAQKEDENGSEDEDLSDLSSPVGEDAEEEEEEEEEGMQTGNEEDAEGEDEDAEGEEIEEDEEMIDSDDITPDPGSRASTPDLTKLTKRQRARLEEGGSGHLLALPDEVQIKKHFTAEEHAMRRAEMARRRKNLSEKRNEEEKMETINKLLKRQAPKTNARRRDFNNIAAEATPDSESVKPEPGFVRWVCNRDGMRIGVPEEWLEAPVGSVFTNSVKRPAGGMGQKMVQEVS